jgi:histidine phosphotransferase ChpT
MSNQKNSVMIDTGILELMSSKVCHDLISPIGAVNNGVEMLEDLGGGADEEVVGLIANSAQQASAKLQAYRMAYGAGGADDTIKPEDVFKSIQAIVGADGKIKQEWDAWGPLGYGDDRPHGYCKLLICCLLLGMECLPKGGTLSVKPGAKAGTSEITATGTDAQVRGQTAKALSNEMHRDILEPKYIHPYVTGLLAKTYGYSVSIGDSGNGSVTIVLALPVA